MNEKIKELAEQAGANVNENMMGGLRIEIIGDHRISKFAELIIDECITACATDRLGKTAGAEDLIKQRFGID